MIMWDLKVFLRELGWLNYMCEPNTDVQLDISVVKNSGCIVLGYDKLSHTTYIAVVWMILFFLVHIGHVGVAIIALLLLWFFE